MALLSIAVLLLIAASTVLLILKQILASPDREIAVRVRLLPSPRIEVEAKAAKDQS